MHGSVVGWLVFVAVCSERGVPTVFVCHVVVCPREQGSSLSSVSFLESADRWIGNNHLFKRSVFLIKVLAHCVSTPLSSCVPVVNGTDYAVASFVFDPGLVPH